VKFLGSAVEWQGLRNGYERPETLGVDRWCVLVGAAASYSYPFIVCDIGTALTIDLVDHSGAHLGGYIAPGLEMMMHALNSKTAISMLPHNAGSGGSTIPTNTQMAVREGCMQSLVSLIDSIMRKHAPQSLCILTGGGAEELHALLETKTTVDKNLLFSGMLRQI
jgi:type III pantothenate kinase